MSKTSMSMQIDQRVISPGKEPLSDGKIEFNTTGDNTFSRLINGNIFQLATDHTE
jgi:hypothetical protein